MSVHFFIFFMMHRFTERTLLRHGDDAVC